jgi:putative addiction module CopG family antidote
MSVALPAEFQQFVSRVVASGKYRSEEEVVATALRLLQEQERKRDALLEDLQQGIDDLEDGKRVTIKEEGEHDAFLASVERRGRERHAARSGNQ